MLFDPILSWFGCPKDFSSLTAKEEVGLLFESHSVMLELLGAVLGGGAYFIFSTEDITTAHLHLRLLIEDLLNEDALSGLREYYFCPIESLHELTAESDIYWEYGDRRRIMEFHTRIAEVHARHRHTCLYHLRQRVHRSTGRADRCDNCGHK